MAGKERKKADIVTVARAARVSISTVSRSFNHPEQVKASTRKKIDRAVRRLGYIRNRAAQTMHGIRSGTIGLVVPTIDNTIFAEMIQSFSSAVEAEGFTLLIASHGYDLEREYAALRKLLEHRVDGVALIGHDHSDETYQLLDRQEIPALSIWNYDPASRLSCVGADNRAAGRLAAEHLIGLGHRRIGLIFPPVADNDRARGRSCGARAALAAAGIMVPPAWDIESFHSPAEAKSAVQALLSRHERPSALLCGNDVLAMGAIYAAQRLEVPVPGALSVIGIGDFRGSSEMEPTLTTVRLPAQRIGRQAGQELARSIIRPGGDPVRIECEIDLVVRGTCAAPAPTAVSPR